MSASDWARCPRCVAKATAELKAREAAVMASYGTVPVAEFDAARQQLAADAAALQQHPATFREDYEIYGARTGTVKVEYSGQCTQCGLSLRFEHEHPIPGLEEGS